MGIQSFPPKASYGSGKNKGTFNTTSSSYVTALNLTGTGALKWLTASFNSGSDQGFMKITIDGVVMFDGVVINTSSTVYVNGTGGTSASSTPCSYDLGFTTSLKIELKTLNAIGTITANWTYELA